MKEETVDTKSNINKKSKVAGEFRKSFIHIDEEDDSMYPSEIELENYIVLHNLGSGSSSKVKLGLHKVTKERVAVKIVPRQRANPSMAKESKEKREIRIFREIIISVLVRHPNIIRLIDFIYDDAYFYLIFEYAEGFSLYDLLLEKGRMDELNARRVFRQILSSIDYLHNNSIVHRDLKIENIIIDINGNVKLIDFGLSNFYDKKQFLKTFCGSLYFAAPELLKGKFYLGPEIDTWSLGVILYTILCGFVPFDDKELSLLQKKIKEGDYILPKFLSNNAKKLLQKILNTNPLMRISLDEIKEDPWVNENYNSKIENYITNRKPIDNLEKDIVNILRNSVSFQFPEVNMDLNRYLEYCITKKEKDEIIIAVDTPVISLYHLLLENNIEPLVSDGVNLERSPFSVRIKHLVDCTMKNKEPIKERGLLNLDIIEKEEIPVDNTAYITNPTIRNSYVQGIFRGISTNKFKSESDFKNFIHNFCDKNKIKLEPLAKNYFCVVKSQNMVSYFKISLFYNIIIRKYVISLKFLCGEENLFSNLKMKIKKQVTV